MIEIIEFARQENPALENLLNDPENTRKEIYLQNPQPLTFPAGLRLKSTHEDRWVFYSYAYQERIPYSQIGAGREVVVLKKHRDREGIKAIVKNRYYEPIDKPKLRSLIVPMDLHESNIYYPKISLPKISFDILSLGHQSSNMDDRWHILPEGKTIHFLRSWTGREMYRAIFAEEEEGDYQLQELHLRNDWEKEIKITDPGTMIRRFIDRHVKNYQDMVNG